MLGGCSYVSSGGVLVSIRPIRDGAKHREPVSPSAGAVMSTACSNASGFGSGLVEPTGENSVGMCRGPVVGQHLIQPRVIRVQAEENRADVTPRLDPMALQKLPPWNLPNARASMTAMSSAPSPKATAWLVRRSLNRPTRMTST